MDHHTLCSVNQRLTSKPCIFNEILGETLRPGGLELTAHIATLADIRENQKVLEIGCGKGTTAAFLAQQYSCRLTGIDISGDMVSCSHTRAVERNLTDQVTFLVADGEDLPFDEASFDVVISECVFSLMRRREKAAREINRVLKPNGRLALTDIVLRGTVDRNLQSQIVFPCCLSNAVSTDEYIHLFQQSGFNPYLVEDQSVRLEEITFRLGMAIPDFDEFAEQVLNRPCALKEGESSVTSSKILLDFLKQSKPGYIAVIMNKTS